MKQIKMFVSAILVLGLLATLSACTNSQTPSTETTTQNVTGQSTVQSSDSKKIKIGVSFDALQSQFWLANYDAIKEEADKLGVEIIEAIAEGDSNKQLQQIENLIAANVDAIICVPKDNKAIVAAIQKANDANVYFITDNRSADEGARVDLEVGADSFEMAKSEAQWLVDDAKSKNTKYYVLELLGDLKDVNAMLRDKAFNEVADANPDYLEVVAQVPTEWKAETALSGTVNALQANKEINCIFVPSDSLLPSVLSALQQQNRYFKADDPNHVVVASFDGAKEGLDAIRDGYVDIDMVQDAVLEGKLCVQGAVKLVKGETLESNQILEEGFAVTRDNFEETSVKAWAYME